MTQATPSSVVSVSVRGRFHAFDLARQLQRHGLLEHLFTTYPKFKVREWGLPNHRISSFPVQEVLNRLVGRAPISAWRKSELRVGLSRYFDAAVAKRLSPDMRLFVGWSSESIASIRRARSLGAWTVVERGSSHILFQNQVLTEEHERAGVRWQGIHHGTIERELQEYAEADFVSVPSSFVRDTFVQRGIDPAKLIVAPYGCDLSLFRPGTKNDSVFRIVHCGQISIQKGVHILIRAFTELRLKDAELWLIGGLTPEIGEILRQTANPRIFVKGPFPQRDLPLYYSQASIFCLASVQEGLALVIPQALASGLPVVATANSGAADVVDEGKNGFVIPASDLDALKEKILLLYRQEPLRRAMAANAAAMSLDLSWNAYGDRIAHAYRRILSSGAVRGAA